MSRISGYYLMHTQAFPMRVSQFISQIIQLIYGVRILVNIEEISNRLEKIERQKNQEVLTLVEILSNVTFFGEIKKANCQYHKNGQCSYFIIKSKQKNTLPILSKCRVKNCKTTPKHCHIETSNITCSLCQQPNNNHKT